MCSKRNWPTYQISAHPAEPLVRVPVLKGSWKPKSREFGFDFPPDLAGNTSIVVFVIRLSKMAHISAVPKSIVRGGTAHLFIDQVFRQHGLYVEVILSRVSALPWAVESAPGCPSDTSSGVDYSPSAASTSIVLKL